MNARNHDRHGTLEYVSGSHGRCRVWRNGSGYLTPRGGYSKDGRRAAVFSGPGQAIAEAQRCGFAVLDW